MNKPLFLVGIVSWVFFSTMSVFVYWTVTDASWWLRDASATAVFLEGMAIMFWGTEKLEVFATINAVLRHFGLVLTTTQRLSNLEQQEFELAVLNAHLYVQHESEV